MTVTRFSYHTIVNGEWSNKVFIVNNKFCNLYDPQIGWIELED
jgi:hypothetical protein